MLHHSVFLFVLLYNIDKPEAPSNLSISQKNGKSYVFQWNGPIIQIGGNKKVIEYRMYGEDPRTMKSEPLTTSKGTECKIEKLRGRQIFLTAVNELGVESIPATMKLGNYLIKL